MVKENSKKIQIKLELLTRRWWFILAFIVLLGFALPPYTSKGYDFQKTGEVIQYILSTALIRNVSPLYPIFKIIPILLVISIFLFRNRMTQFFSIYAGISYILFAVLQGISITERYGLRIVTGNFIMMLIVAIFWLLEARLKENDFTPKRPSLWNYLFFLSAFLAFWYPADLKTLRPDFNPVYLFTNLAGLAFCTMTPVFLAILIYFYPKVNIPTLRVTALAGIIIGFWNMVVNFIIAPKILWWNGVLHIPLVVISVYSLIISYSRRISQGQQE